MKQMKNSLKYILLFFTAALCNTSLNAQNFLTGEPAQISGNTANSNNGWDVQPLVTVGETDNTNTDVNLQEFNYRIPGIPDGIGAFKNSHNDVDIFFNNELGASRGYAYQLANGTQLTGARISYIEIDRNNREVEDAGLAYGKIYDRAGKIVTDPSQINEGVNPSPTLDGFERFCSAYGAKAGTNGLANDIYFAGEETTNGQECVLDVKKKELYVVPMLGRAAWENVTTVENFGTDKVVLLIGDDREGSPLMLYIGKKNSKPYWGYNPPQFLKQNGLGRGHLYVWVSDDFAVNGERNPTTFHGTNNLRKGKFVRIEHYNANMAGTTGYDSQGFADQATQDAAADAVNHFEFLRPEDIATNPDDETQIVMASTGFNGMFNGIDSWGTIYKIDFDDKELKKKLHWSVDGINNIPATIAILYDGNDAGNGQFASPDFGLRSPDNLDWAKNDYIYIQEDRSYTQFGLTSGIEASMWQLDPETGLLERVLEIDRSAVPYGQTDGSIGDIGNWESSGVLDVTNLFRKKHEDETLLIIDVQAHSLKTGPIGGNSQLVEGGQLLLASKIFTDEHSNKTSEEFIVEEPRKAGMLSAYPNPFSSNSEIAYSLTQDAKIQITVYDVYGRLIKTLVDSQQLTGDYKTSWDGSNEQGQKVSNGIYFVRMIADGKQSSISLMVAK